MPDFSNIPSSSQIGDQRDSDFFVDLYSEDLDLPKGFRFLPDDQELITHYLANKVLKRSLPLNVIKILDIYSCDPDKLPIKILEDGTETEAYFFMENNEVYRRKIIATDNGFWLQIGKEEAIYLSSTVIGFRKNRTFYSNMCDNRLPEWQVNELRLNFDFLPYSELNDDVRNEVDRSIACRIIKRITESNLHQRR